MWERIVKSSAVSGVLKFFGLKKTGIVHMLGLPVVWKFLKNNKILALTTVLGGVFAQRFYASRRNETAAAV